MTTTTMKPYRGFFGSTMDMTKNHDRNRRYQTDVTAVPDSLRQQMDTASYWGVHSQGEFDKYFFRAMAVNRREDLANNYSRLSDTEKSIFVTALANRGVLDKQKQVRKGAQRAHVEEAKRQTIIRDMTEALRMGGDEAGETVQAAPEVYLNAARAMLTAQISDADETTLSKRDTRYDLKLVNRAFKLVREANEAADKADMAHYSTPGGGGANHRLAGGYDDVGIVEFHKDVTHGEKLAAANVSDMNTFETFYKSLRKDGSKNIAVFQKYSGEEKELFVWALSHPSKVVKSVGPLRHNARHKDADRQAAKQDLAQNGVSVAPDDFRRAALMLLSKEGRYYKAKLSYNQPIVRDAMHFVRAAQMVKVTSLRQKHEELAKQDDSGNLSGDTKWSATLSIDVERGKMRILAEKVHSLEAFNDFVELGVKRSGDKYESVLTRYQALDARSKTLLIQGLSKRKTTQGHTDRSRLKFLQKIGNFFAGSSVMDEEGRKELMQQYSRHKLAQEAQQEMPLADVAEDAYRAAINLVSKDTQTLVGNRSQHIDIGMLERGFRLIDDAEKYMRKQEAGEAGAKKGYVHEATQLRQQFSEGTQEHKEHVTEHEYKAVSLATRQNVRDASHVNSLDSFDSFFAALMESDDNTGRYATFSQYTSEQKTLFIRALAHRDVLDRKRDKAIFTRYLRLHDLHGYKGRAKRNEMKLDYAARGVDQVRGSGRQIEEPTAEEYKAAAFSILSRETRRANWISKVTHRKTGDDRLLERAMKFVSVADDKREQAEDVERRAAMQAMDPEGGDQITRRATEEIKLLADQAKDIPSFDQYMVKAVNLKYMKKYAALGQGDKNLLVKALANRRALDQKDKEQVEDARKRTELVFNAVAEKKNAEAEPTEFRMAAYNLLGSKGRALGKHRFLWIKFGAANTSLLDKAFDLIKKTDAERDKAFKHDDRDATMQQYGVSKLSSSVPHAERARADAVTDLESFGKFLHEQAEKQHKEKYAMLYDSYGDEVKRHFVSALARYTKAFAKQEEDKQFNQVAVFTPGKTPRAAAYRLIEHQKGNSPALHYAVSMADKLVRGLYESKKKQDSTIEADLDEFAMDQELTSKIDMPELTEFDHTAPVLGQAEKTKTSWLRRKAGEGFRNFGAWARDTHEKHRNAVSTTVRNLDRGSFGRGAARFFLYTLNPFIWEMSKTGNEADRERASGVADKDTFLSYLKENAEKDKRVSLYNAVKSLSEEELTLLVNALQDRTILDASNEEGAAFESQNEEGRTDLLKRYVKGEPLGGGNALYTKAAVALTTRRVLQKSRASSELDKVQTRSTAVDWELMEDALAFVQFVARDEKQLYARSVADGRTQEGEPDVDHFRTGEETGGTVDRLISTGKNIFDVGMAGKGIYDQSKNILTGEGMDPNRALPGIRNIGQAPKQAAEILGVEKLKDAASMDFIKSSMDAKNLQRIIANVQNADVVKDLSASGTAVIGLVTNTIGLIKSSVNLGIESYRMQNIRDQSDDFEKQMTLKEKADIIQQALADAFGKAKELQAKDVNECVFGILNAICGLVAGGLALAGVPAPIVTLVKKVSGMVLKAGKWVVDKIIALVNGDRVQELLQVEKRTHLYNQRVKAYNARPGMPKSQKRDLITTGQMQRKLLRESGLRSEAGAHDYLCRKTATCLVYAYGDPNPKSTERMAAANLFAGLKVPYKPGSSAPKVTDLAAKLRGAH